MRRCTLLALCILALSTGALSARARAFSDPERFTAPTDEGGGGGRFFTGSWSDGFTCAVCHRGGPAPDVRITGMPTNGFLPGQLVEAELSFGNDQRNHALALEVVDDLGRDLGLEILPDEQIAITERCGAVQGAQRASYLAEAGARRVLGVEACEAKTVRFRFRTPQSPRIMFVATVLASDNSASIEGDGVTEIAQSLFQNGKSAGAAASSGCSSVVSGRASMFSVCSLLVLALLARQRRSRRPGTVA
jgi:hypothetical protein